MIRHTSRYGIHQDIPVHQPYITCRATRRRRMARVLGMSKRCAVVAVLARGTCVFGYLGIDAQLTGKALSVSPKTSDATHLTPCICHIQCHPWAEMGFRPAGSGRLSSGHFDGQGVCVCICVCMCVCVCVCVFVRVMYMMGTV